MRAAQGAVSHDWHPREACRAGRSSSLRLSFRIRAPPRSETRSRAATAHVQAAAPFQQRSIPGKGDGLIAAQDITAGSVLLLEDALVTFTATAAEEWDALSAAVKGLDEPQRAAYFGLANSFANQFPQASTVPLLLRYCAAWRISRLDSASKPASCGNHACAERLRFCNI
jgi:hypothetical protein